MSSCNCCHYLRNRSSLESKLVEGHCPACCSIRDWISFLPQKIQEIGNPQGEMPEPKKCTCGAASVNSNGHSNWCDLYETELAPSHEAGGDEVPNDQRK